MIGFLALASVILALLRGGWWWALAISLILGWIGKRSEDKKITKTQRDNLTANAHANQRLESVPQGITSNKQMQAATTFATKVEQICAQFSFNDYYVADTIPPAKHANAMALYPPPGGGKVIALVDATVFGSAKNGLAVGANGISWHNDSLNKSPISKLIWSQFSSTRLEEKGSDLFIGKGKINLAGSQMKPRELIEVLRALQILLEYESNKQPAKSASPPSSVLRKSVDHLSDSPDNLNAVVDVNRATFDDLLSLPGIGAAEAHLVIKRRSDEPFTSVAELVQFLDLKPHFVTRLEARTLFNPSRDGSHRESGDAIVATPASRGRIID